MKREFLTDEEVEAEIAKLKKSKEVKLAEKEIRLRYKRRKQLYNLRALKKRGKDLMNAGINENNIDEMFCVATNIGEDNLLDLLGCE